MPKYAGLAVGCAFLGLLVLFPHPAYAETYQWTDEQGNLHFTDNLTNVPPASREKVKEVPLPEYEPPPPSSSQAVSSPPAGSSSGNEKGASPLNVEQVPPVDAAAKCREDLRKEKDRLKKQLAVDSARLEELNMLIHRTARSRLKNRYQRERVDVKERIQQTRNVMEQEWPRREWECGRQ